LKIVGQRGNWLEYEQGSKYRFIVGQRLITWTVNSPSFIVIIIIIIYAMLGFKLRASALARQVLYGLSHISCSFFAQVILEVGFPCLPRLE
jgi:hypothetical protein